MQDYPSASSKIPLTKKQAEADAERLNAMFNDIGFEYPFSALLKKTNNMYEQALTIATEAHKNQKRKKTGEPYINHPLRVAAQFTDDLEKTLAILHDVFENGTMADRDKITVSFPLAVIDGLILLSREEDETYFAFIIRIIRSGNMAAMRVKYEDLTDNMSDLEEGSMKDKYRLARHLIKICAELKSK